MHVFIAGATGAIGQPLLRALSAAGHTVTAMVRSDRDRERPWKMPLERPSARSRPSRASTISSMTIRLPLPIGFRDLRSGSAALIRRM